MNAVNAVQLFILVWTFTDVCQADGDISVSCADVTGTVRKEVTFTCSVSLKKSDCCISLYKFRYPEKYNNSEICRENSSCEQRNFTCSFSSTTVMTGQFRFFIQTNCGRKDTEFTVNITDINTALLINPSPGFRTEDTVIAAVTGCFIIFIIIIIVTIIYKKKPNYSKPCGFQRRIFLGHKHDDNNSNFQEQNPKM
ncbi:uncharacterized protein LOC143718238 [Siphateles boraxobius]|uniref:uncharacterized protein LOC143718238 n=1 Tax=Siphateles boraxobius TaxID=180520 RepID=UPI0040632F9C